MRTKHFELHELVPPDVLVREGERGWLQLDSRLLWTLDALWEHLQPLRPSRVAVVVNTYHWGGNSRYHGYRPPSCTIGAPLSQHRAGRAVDVVVPSIPSAEVAAFILASRREPWTQHIRRIEDPAATPGWTHIDLANTDSDSILTFFP